MRPVKFTLDRVTGYHRPLKNWNAGKQEEFKDRKFHLFDLDELESAPVSSGLPKRTPLTEEEKRALKEEIKKMRRA